MGKSFISIKQNGYNIEQVYNLLKNKEVVEATEEEYFTKKPQLLNILEIEIGTDGTKESIFRLIDGGYFVVSGTIKHSP